MIRTTDSHAGKRAIPRWVRAAGFMLCSFFSRSDTAMPMRVPLPPQDVLYSPRKAAQVVAYFALRQGGRAIDVLKAIKLAYLADRESLRRWGAPILHEPRASLKLGPVNRTTLDYINGLRVDPDGWGRIVLPRDQTAKSIGVAAGVVLEDLDEFSPAELEVLDQVWTRHGRYRGFSTAAWTHRPSNIPEWEDPNGGSRPIELISILQAVGFPDPEKAIERIEEQRTIERTFRSLTCPE